MRRMFVYPLVYQQPLSCIFALAMFSERGWTTERTG
jgi:hypothetical protein